MLCSEKECPVGCCKEGRVGYRTKAGVFPPKHTPYPASSEPNPAQYYFVEAVREQTAEGIAKKFMASATGVFATPARAAPAAPDAQQPATPMQKTLAGIVEELRRTLKTQEEAIRNLEPRLADVKLVQQQFDAAVQLRTRTLQEIELLQKTIAEAGALRG